MMRDRTDHEKDNTAAARLSPADGGLHPAWRAFIRYCVELQHGEIELLKIQDGFPVLAEVIKKKVKFASSVNKT